MTRLSSVSTSNAGIGITPFHALSATEIVRQRTKDTELKRFAVSLMEKTGSFEYTIRVLNDLEQAIRNEVQKLGGNSLLMGFIESLSVSKLN